MKVLITGANGMVAKAAIKHCAEIGDDVLSYTSDQLDISVKGQVSDIVGAENPDIVFNCAAYTDVDGAESDREKCFNVNAGGVENLATIAKKIGCRFVTISTDYVFDGIKEGLYTQRDTPNPQAVYAKTKLEGEVRARNTYARSIVVRAGWIFGQHGTNFLSLMHKLLEEKRELKVIQDSYGTPTFASDLASRMRELAVLDLPAIYHVANDGNGASFHDFALKVCEIGDFDKSLVHPIDANQLERPAARPKNSGLRCLFSRRFGLGRLPRWEKALERSIK